MPLMVSIFRTPSLRTREAISVKKFRNLHVCFKTTSNGLMSRVATSFPFSTLHGRHLWRQKFNHGPKEQLKRKARYGQNNHILALNISYEEED